LSNHNLQIISIIIQHHQYQPVSQTNSAKWLNRNRTLTVSWLVHCSIQSIVYVVRYVMLSADKSFIKRIWWRWWWWWWWWSAAGVWGPSGSHGSCYSVPMPPSPQDGPVCFGCRQNVL